MRMTYLADEIERQEFAKRAAIRFAENDEMATYSDDALKTGCYLALRWGLGDDCVLVVKLDENVEPINYQALVQKYK